MPLVIVLMENKAGIRGRLRDSEDGDPDASEAGAGSGEDADVAGCLFHFAQAQWRRLQEAGLAVAYRRELNEAMRTDFHALIALAFIPLDDVEDAFDALSEEAVLILQPVFQHVEAPYLRGRLRARPGGRVRGRVPPLFPPHLWNCHQRTMEGLPRTTNTCEAWHRRLSSLIGKHHPSFFVFLGQLREEVGEIDVLITRAEGGLATPPQSGGLPCSRRRRGSTGSSTGMKSTRKMMTLSPTYGPSATTCLAFSNG
ncbi:WD repeat-containing protein on Y chromosome [Frankliniella fusca]|uniref:WD repeat-containing protein on Y chromosome n=1 Tax=Frankliniella fusca TaxID=407009 RepID=A0AAE1I2T4_9NEOP|nr:WD repeat-containing protein on Y chromosome [Frankliniella fusca]